MTNNVGFLLRGFARGVEALVDAESAIVRVRQLHTPMPGDEHAAQQCRHCIAGYDPKTGLLVHAAWPCSTIAVLDDKE